VGLRHDLWPRSSKVSSPIEHALFYFEYKAEQGQLIQVTLADLAVIEDWLRGAATT